MLYKTISAVPLTIPVLLTNPISATIFPIYASTATIGTKTIFCESAGPNDICEFHCDEEKKQFSLECGTVQTCQVFCEKKECMKLGTINATNSDFLQVSSPGSNCIKTGHIYVPSSGNASLLAGHNGLKETNIYSGQNTQNIYIDCFSTGDGVDDCKDINIHAQDAQYLEIYVGPGGLEGAIINCPINSTYIGPSEASCIIDATGNGILLNSQINTLNGIPFDVWIFGTNQYNRVTIYCNSGASNASTTGFTSVDLCWNTRAPTGSPSKYITNSPTTSMPTSTPITTSPTTTPNSATNSPTTFIPTTSIPTTSIPTTSMPTTSIPTTSMPTTSTAFTTGALNGKDDTVFQWILYVGLSIVCCCICGLCWMIRRNAMKAHKSGNLSSYQTGENRLRIPSLSTRKSSITQNVNPIAIFQKAKSVSISLEGVENLPKKLADYNMENEMVKVETKLSNIDETPEMNSIITKGKEQDTAQEEVRLWLLNDVGLPEYYDTFIENGYDTLDIIKSMEDKTYLQDIGILLKAHQSKIWVEIEKLRQYDHDMHKEPSLDCMQGDLHIHDNQSETHEESYVEEKPTPGMDNLDAFEGNSEGR